MSVTYEQASASLAALEREVQRIETERATFQRLAREAGARQDEAQALAADLSQALVVLQNLEGTWRRGFEESLAALVSRGLTAVFGEAIRLNIENRIVRDVMSTELSLTLGEGPEELTTPIVGSAGGSVVNVLSVLLRLVLTVSARPPLRKVLILDEPFAFIDEYDMPETVAALMRELADSLGLQFIVVSHEQALVEAADVAYEVTRKGSAAKVQRIRNRSEEVA